MAHKEWRIVSGTETLPSHQGFDGKESPGALRRKAAIASSRRGRDLLETA